MTNEHQASRTLVKSPPELWTECSDAASLARHLGEFGEIQITRLEPETTVAWEGEHASGTVQLEVAGWGTKVTLTAKAKAEPVPEPAAADGGAAVAVSDEVVEPEHVEEEPDAKVEASIADPDPALASDSHHRAAGGRWRRLIARTRERFKAPAEAREPETLPEAVEADPAEALGEETPATEPPQEDPATAAKTIGSEAAPAADPAAVLAAALESLGQAHHRPFSRA